MLHFSAALEQQILDISQTQREPDIPHQADDSGES